MTINADFVNINIRVGGNFGKNGENRVLEKAMDVYGLFKLKTDLKINNHLYHYIQAIHPPVHSSYDAESGQTAYDIDLEVFRQLEGDYWHGN